MEETNEIKNNLVGRKFGNLTVVRQYDKPYMWICLCDCGKEHIISERLLLGRMVANCSCKKGVENHFIGKQFGGLTIVEFDEHTKQCVCFCSCGRKVKTTLDDLENYKIRRCNADNHHANILGKQFGSCKTIKFLGNGYWLCKCVKCGMVRSVSIRNLMLDNNTNCCK